jgi:hypothetical protein
MRTAIFGRRRAIALAVVAGLALFASAEARAQSVVEIQGGDAAGLVNALEFLKNGEVVTILLGPGVYAIPPGSGSLQIGNGANVTIRAATSSHTEINFGGGGPDFPGGNLFAGIIVSSPAVATFEGIEFSNEPVGGILWETFGGPPTSGANGFGLTIRRCTFTNCGEAVKIDQNDNTSSGKTALLGIINSTFAGNATGVSVDGTSAALSEVFLSNCTIVDNTTGGVDASAGGQVILMNSIVTRNDVRPGVSSDPNLNVSTPVLFQGNNYVGPVLLGPGGILPGSVALEGLADNGGPTETVLPLAATSALLEIPLASTQGDDGNPLAFDARGRPRWDPTLIGAVDLGLLASDLTAISNDVTGPIATQSSVTALGKTLGDDVSALQGNITTAQQNVIAALQGSSSATLGSLAATLGSSGTTTLFGAIANAVTTIEGYIDAAVRTIDGNTNAAATAIETNVNGHTDGAVLPVITTLGSPAAGTSIASVLANVDTKVNLNLDAKVSNCATTAEVQDIFRGQVAGYLMAKSPPLDFYYLPEPWGRLDLVKDIAHVAASNLGITQTSNPNAWNQLQLADSSYNLAVQAQTPQAAASNGRSAYKSYQSFLLMVE